jgi:tetratricopeptide (TPR) repeat protein
MASRAAALCLWSLMVPAPVGARPDSDLQALVDAGHWKQLRVIVESRVMKNAGDAPATYRLSQVELAYGHLDRALALAERAVSLDKSDAAYHVQLAKVCLQEVDTASVLKVFGWIHRFEQEAQTALQLDAANIDARLSLMGYRSDHHERDKAALLADDIMRLSPAEGALAHAELARRDNPKDVQAISAWLLRAISAEPTNYRAHALLAQYYAADPALDDRAIQEARLAQQIDPGRVTAYIVVARTYAALHDTTRLDGILAEAQRNVPDNLAPFFQAGLLLLQQNAELPRAEACLRRYLGQEPEAEGPKLSRAHWRLGLVLEKLNRKAEAIAEIETAVRLEPDLVPMQADLKRLKGGTA